MDYLSPLDIYAYIKQWLDHGGSDYPSDISDAVCLEFEITKISDIIDVDIIVNDYITDNL